MKLEHSRQIFEKFSNINFMKIRPVRAELFRGDRGTERRTDITKLIVTFRHFVDTPKNRRENDKFDICT